MTLFDTLHDYGFWPFGLWREPVVIDQNPMDADQPLQERDPIERPAISHAGAGAYPGFDPCPPFTNRVAWQMRGHEAIRIAMTSIGAPIMAGTQTMEVAEDGGNKALAEEICGAIGEATLPMLDYAIEPALESLTFEHWTQEVIYGTKDGKLAPVALRSINPGEAVLHADVYRNFSGFQIGSEFRDARYAFHCVCNPHIDPVLGWGRSRNALPYWWRSVQSELNADKTEQKASGIQLLLGVPVGKTFVDKSGKPTMPDAMASTILNAAKAGKSATYPLYAFSKEDIIAHPELAAIPALKADKFDWGNIGQALSAHLERLDRTSRSIIRCYGRPEREATEGKHGTKAESDVQGQIGVLDSELVRAFIFRQWDAQVVRTCQIARYGPDTGVVLRTKPAPLADQQQEFLQKLVEVLSTDTNTGPPLLDNVDSRGLLTRTDVPVVSEEDAAKATATRLAQAKTNTTPQLQDANGDPNQVPVNGKMNGKKQISPRVARIAKRLAGDN